MCGVKFGSIFCFIVILAMSMRVQALSDRTLARRGQHHKTALTKRDRAPEPASLFRLQCGVDPGWASYPWYFDPHVNKPVSCNAVYYTGIQAGECYTNSRINNNVFSVFMPHLPSVKNFGSEGGPYGECIGFDCAPPAEVLRNAPNENFGCYWWIGGDKSRWGLIPPTLSGVTRVPYPITCPSNLENCYSEKYYESGGAVSLLATQKPTSCEVYFSRKKNRGPTWCNGVGLGCAIPTFIELARGIEAEMCDVSKCQEPNLKSFTYDICDWSPGSDGCSKRYTDWSNHAKRTGPCSMPDAAQATRECRTCLKEWNSLPKDSNCFSIASVPNLKGPPANFQNYMVASPENKEKILEAFPKAPACELAGTVTLPVGLSPLEGHQGAQHSIVNSTTTPGVVAGSGSGSPVNGNNSNGKSSTKKSKKKSSKKKSSKKPSKRKSFKKGPSSTKEEALNDRDSSSTN